MANQYWVGNFAVPTTAAPVKVATTTSIQTLLCLSVQSTKGILIKAWGCSFDGSAAATPGNVELFGTTVNITSGGTTVVANKYNCPNDEAAITTAQFSPTGSPVVEGTVANYRSFDNQLIAPTGQYVYQWPLGNEPKCAVSTFVRVRATFGTSVNALCWIQWEE